MNDINIKIMRYESILTKLINEFILSESDKDIFITILKLEPNKKQNFVKVHCSVFPTEKLQSAEFFLQRRVGECKKYIRRHSNLKIIPGLVFKTHTLNT